MAGKYWQAGKYLIPARALLCLVALATARERAWAMADDFAPARYVASLDPNVLWEVLIGGIVVCAFLASIALWIFSALRRVKRSLARKNAFVSSPLNNLSQGVVMTDPRTRVVFCNDRYLEIYGLSRADFPPNM